MVDATLSLAKAEVPKYVQAIDDEHGNIWSELQNRTSYNWGYKDYGERDPGCTWCGEKEFAERVLDEIGNDSLEDKETVIIPHDQFDWGYGHNYGFVRDGKDVHAALVYGGGFIPEREVRIMTWHEAAHTWVWNSGDGSVDSGTEHDTARAETELYSNNFKNLTPLSASYAQDKYSNSYMMWEGHGSHTDYFNHYLTDAIFNGQGDAQDNHHPAFILEYSPETIGFVDKYL